MYDTRVVSFTVEINEQGDVFVLKDYASEGKIRIGRFCRDSQLVGNAIAKYLDDFESFDTNMELHLW